MICEYCGKDKLESEFCNDRCAECAADTPVCCAVITSEEAEGGLEGGAVWPEGSIDADEQVFICGEPACHFLPIGLGGQYPIYMLPLCARHKEAREKAQSTS